MCHAGFNSFSSKSLCFIWVLTVLWLPELQRVVFDVGFSSFDEESSCFMWVLMLFGCPELQRVVFHVGFTSFAPNSLAKTISEVEGGENYAVFPRLTGKSISISIRSCVRCEAVRGRERQVPPQRWGSGWEEFLLLRSVPFRGVLWVSNTRKTCGFYAFLNVFADLGAAF